MASKRGSWLIVRSQTLARRFADLDALDEIKVSATSLLAGIDLQGGRMRRCGRSRYSAMTATYVCGPRGVKLSLTAFC